LNEIGRWSESSAKDENLIPADRVQGRFNERVRSMPARYSSVTPTTLWVAGILTQQTASVRSMLESIEFDHLPVEGSLELLTQNQQPNM
jgi:hypothetical protein